MFRLHYRKPGATTWFHTPTVHESHGAAIRESAGYCAAGFTEVKVTEAPHPAWNAAEDRDMRERLKRDIAKYEAEIQKLEKIVSTAPARRKAFAANPRTSSSMDLHSFDDSLGDYVRELAAAKKQLVSTQKALVDHNARAKRLSEAKSKPTLQAEREVADLQAKIKTAAAARDKAKQARERFDAAEEKPIRDKVIALRSELAAADALFKKLQYKAADLATEWRRADNECAALEKELAKAQKKLK